MTGLLPLSTKSMIVVGTVVLLSSPTLSSLACENRPNPLAFEMSSSGDTELLPNGMMTVVHGNSRGEHRKHITVHRVVMVLSGRHPLIPEAHDPHYKVVETDGTLNPMTYIIVANALYYGMGKDSIGFPEKSWIDPEEDGLNGNEHPMHEAEQTSALQK